MRNYTNKELFDMEPVEVYKLRLKGEVQNFPKRYFEDNEVCRIILKYLIDDILMLPKDDICKKITVKVLKEYKLNGMFQIAFKGSRWKLIEFLYPGEFKPWQMGNIPYNYWNKETARKAIVWLVEEKNNWNEEQICKNFTWKVLSKNGMREMVKKVFNSSLYDAINFVYPEKFKPWQLAVVPNGYWNNDNSREAIIWLVEEKLKLSEEEIASSLTRNVLRENGLLGLLNCRFHGNKVDMLNNAYPDKFIMVKQKVQLKC